jgi:hypothetical protein
LNAGGFNGPRRIGAEFADGVFRFGGRARIVRRMSVMTLASRRPDPSLARAAKRQKRAADPEGLRHRERLFVEAYVLNRGNAARAYQACMHRDVTASSAASQVRAC